MHYGFVTAVASIAIGSLGCSGAAPETDPRVAPGGGASLSAATFVRLVNLISDAPAFDVCLRAHADDPSAPFETGPLLAAHGLSGGLAYPQASAYVEIAPGAYDLRVVAAGAIDCAARLDGIPDRTDLRSLESGGFASLVAVGSLAKSFFALDVHGDEPPTTERAKLRFVHDTVAAPALDVGTGVGDTFAPLFTSVPFRAAGAADANGYLDVEPTDATLVVRVAGRAFDTLTVPSFALAPATSTTVFSIGVAGQGGSLLASVLRCADGEASAASLSNCSVVP
jgi:hypothetical protein